MGIMQIMFIRLDAPFWAILGNWANNCGIKLKLTVSHYKIGTHDPGWA
jgi:hypothetical protein